MIKISKQQILQRWDTLPDTLKEALFSQYNADTLWRICEAQHLSEDKTSQIAMISGDVIFGFLGPEDLADEIKNSVGLNQEIANNIAMEIDRKIFAPIRLDLEKVYAPATEGEMIIPPSAEEILDLRKIEPAAMPEAAAIAEAPKIIGVEEKPSFAEPAAETREKMPIAGLTPESQLVSPSALFGGGEVEPMIIHKEMEIKPLSEGKKSLGGLFGFFKKKEGTPESVRAQVEIGDQTFKAEPSAPKIARTEPSKIRVVHYTEVPETISPFPMANGKTEAQPPENLPIAGQAEPVALNQVELPEISQAEPSMASQAEPITGPIEPAIIVSPEETESKPFAANRTEPVVIKPEVSRVETSAEPILDLRRTPPETKPTAEEPSPELPEAAPAKPEEQVIDLGMFK